MKFLDLCLDAVDAGRAADFWAPALGLTAEPVDDKFLLTDGDDEHRLWINPVPEPRTVKQRVHLDLNVAFGDPWKRPTGYGTATKTGDWFSMASKADLDKVVRAALDRHWYYKRDTLGGASRETVSYDEQMRWLNADIRTLNAKLDALVDAVGVLLEEKKEGAE